MTSHTHAGVTTRHAIVTQQCHLPRSNKSWRSSGEMVCFPLDISKTASKCSANRSVISSLDLRISYNSESVRRQTQTANSVRLHIAVICQQKGSCARRNLTNATLLKTACNQYYFQGGDQSSSDNNLINDMWQLLKHVNNF